MSGHWITIHQAQALSIAIHRPSTVAFGLSRHAQGGDHACADLEPPSPRPAPLVARELREHFPPASHGQDTYTLLKFYNLSEELLRSVLDVRP